MKITGQVLNTSIERRELVGKDGTRKEHTFARILLLVDEDGVKCAVSVKTFDHPDYMDSSKLPPVGKTWTSPRVRKYESMDGQIAEVNV